MFSEHTRKILLDLGQTAILVFNRIMQQRRDGPGFILYQAIDKLGDPHTMGLKIRLTAQPQLTPVKLLPQLVSPGDFRRARLKMPRKAEFIQNLRTNLINKLYFNHHIVP